MYHISLLSMIEKLLKKSLKELSITAAFKPHIHSFLNPYQSGFRAHVSTEILVKDVNSESYWCQPLWLATVVWLLPAKHFPLLAYKNLRCKFRSLSESLPVSFGHSFFSPLNVNILSGSYYGLLHLFIYIQSQFILSL